MKFFTLSIITGLILWPGIGSAELYTWTDDEGNLHIADALPPELQKKSGSAVKHGHQSVQPMKAMPQLSRAEAHPVPEPSTTPYLSEDAIRLDREGLSPSQATLTSVWQTFDGARSVAKAPVQRWKDGRGVEHFADVLPTARHSAKVDAMPSAHQSKAP